jgi:hypothetical protein
MNTQSIILSNSDLRNRGWAYEFTVEIDNEGPQLISLAVDPPTVNTTVVRFCNLVTHSCY